MAFPQVRSVQSSRSNTAANTLTITYPGTIVAGDILLTVVSIAQGDSATDELPSNDAGFTSVYDGYGVYVLWKEAAGTESGTWTISTDGSLWKHASWSFAISGADASAIYSVRNTSAANTGSHSPSPGSSEYLWLQFGYTRRNDNSFTSAPTGFGAVSQITTTGADTSTNTSDCRLAYATYQFEGSTLDASAWSTSGNTDTLRAAQIAILPAAASIPTISETTKIESGQPFTITGTNFEAVKGTNGRVVISPTDAAGAGTGSDDLNAVVQTIVDVGDWSATSITVDAADVSGMLDGDTVYVFVRNDSLDENAAGFSASIADMVLRVGSGVLADTIKDTDTGVDILTEALSRVVVLSGAAGSTVLVDEYIDASIVSGVLEYDDSSHFNVTTEGDTFLVAIEGSSANRYGLLPAKVVDRNDDP